MKKKTIKYSIATIIILFLVYQINVGLALGIDTFFINLFPRTKLPSELVDYKNLSEVKKFGNHDITLFHKGGAYNFNFQVLSISNDKIMVKVITKTEAFDHGGGNSGSNFSNTLFKLDSFGKVLDTTTFKTSSSDQSEFGDIVLLNKQIVNKAFLYYQTWPADGNKAKQAFIAINKDLTWTTERLSKYYYDTIVPNSIYLEPFYAWRDDSIPVDKRESIVYFANNQWYVLYGVGSEISKNARIQSNDHNKKIINENLLSDIPNDKIKIKYYQKLKYESNMAGQTQSNSPYTYYYWQGIAYINIAFEKDTLKFKKEDVYLDDYDNKERSIYDSTSDNKQKMENSVKEKYSYYFNPNLKFTIISDNETKNLYLVKK
ncbi:hypothetical protein [Flavobacterium sp. C3NV]|jgi:hypothetical protein|uniref:hypothetical protein n=1 Tax=Flavobacterium sp. C3NV TaxID=3393358 RepID=UPI00398FE11C